MKKRTKLMLGLSAMLLATAGVAATGTFAWFQAAAPSISPTTAGETGSIAAEAGFTSVNGFTVTVEAASIAPAGAVLLTNDSGQVYSTTADNGSDYLISDPTGTKIATITPTLTITYTGSSSSLSEIEALWDAALVAHPVTLTISDTTNYAAAGQATTNFSNALVAYAGEHEKGYDYGLKFTGGASSYAQTASDNSANEEKTISVANVGFTGSTSGSGDSKTITKTGVASGVSFYVGIIGINGVLQDANDTYSFKVAPSV